MLEEKETSKFESQVDLDTDDVKEQDIQIENKEEPSKEPTLNVGEVDLGYTSHSKEEEKEKIEVEEETDIPTPSNPNLKKEEKEDDLNQISESVQKRIDKLTRRYREAERREQN
jgi:hypothetical protein